VRQRIRGRQRRKQRAERRSSDAETTPRPAAPLRGAADDVIGWQALVLARPQRCERCEILLGRGDAAYASVTSKGIGEVWRCEGCLRG
jgi:hypothetical protein